jgi:hypothetical protein
VSTLQRLSALRRLEAPEPGTARDLGRQSHELDAMFRGLLGLFQELPSTPGDVITAAQVRPALQLGEVRSVDTTGGDVRLYLPSASKSDAGRCLAYVKKFSNNAIELVPSDGSLVNTLTRWPSVRHIGLHYAIWDGAAWWTHEPAQRVNRHAVTPGTVGLWQFNSSNGLADFSGNGRTLSVEAGTERYAWLGSSITGLYLDGATSIWLNSADAGVRLTGDMSFGALFLLQAETNSAVFFSHMAAGETEDTNQLYGLRFSTAPTVQWLSESGLGVDSSQDLANPFLTPHQVMHFYVTRSSDVLRLYVNGRLANTVGAALTTPTGGATGRLRIGANSAGNFMRGIITSAKLSNRALPTAEVEDEYNQCMGPAFGFIAEGTT